MDRLAQMLEMQRVLQINSYNIDPGHLPTNDKIQFMKDMILALENELQAEILNEFDWKPWTTGERRINDVGIKKELVDVWHLFMNLMLSVNMTTDELYKMYMTKNRVNATRMASGAYDGHSTKCPNPKCKRALEDVSLQEIKLPGTNITDVVLCECGENIDREIAQQFLID